jgi:hypothetical protein
MVRRMGRATTVIEGKAYEGREEGSTLIKLLRKKKFLIKLRWVEG